MCFSLTRTIPFTINTCLYPVKLFHVLLCITKNLIKHHSFVCTRLNDYKYIICKGNVVGNLIFKWVRANLLAHTNVAIVFIQLNSLKKTRPDTNNSIYHLCNFIPSQILLSQIQQKKKTNWYASTYLLYIKINIKSSPRMMYNEDRENKQTKYNRRH